MSRHYDRLQVCFDASNSFPYLQVHVGKKRLVILMIPVIPEQLKFRVKVFKLTEPLSLPRIYISLFCLLEFIVSTREKIVTFCGSEIN